MENRNSASPLPYPIRIGKLPLWSDRGSFSTVLDRDDAGGIAKYVAVLPARYRGESRVGRPFLRAPRSQHGRTCGPWPQHGGHRFRNCFVTSLCPKGCRQIHAGVASFVGTLVSESSSFCSVSRPSCGAVGLRSRATGVARLENSFC